MKICLMFLTCKDDAEAAKISKVLLEKKLVVCIKVCPVASAFLWKGKIDEAKEVILVMDSFEENFNRVEKEVGKIHSYDTFTLFSVPITQTTGKVKKWMEKENGQK